MKRLALTTALVLSIAAPAFASDQLAASLGVADQGFSTAELVQLSVAYEEADAARVNFLLKHGGDDAATASTKSFGNEADQLADSLGVNGSDYTRGELAALKSAVEADDAARIAAITSHAAANSGDTPAFRTQLAAAAGVDVNDLSRAELVRKVSD